MGKSLLFAQRYEIIVPLWLRTNFGWKPLVGRAEITIPFSHEMSNISVRNSLLPP